MSTEMSKRTKVTNPFYDRLMRESTPRRKVTNPYFDKLHTKIGRPKKARVSCKTVTKSVRLTPEIWERFVVRAESEGKSCHAALRQAILIWLRS